MKIDYLYRHKEFKKVLEKELDRLIEGSQHLKRCSEIISMHIKIHLSIEMIVCWILHSENQSLRKT